MRVQPIAWGRVTASIPERCVVPHPLQSIDAEPRWNRRHSKAPFGKRPANTP